jgi:integrase
MMQEYVTHIRPKISGARKHQFLFVSHQTGRPLSDRALNKIFVGFRDKIQDMPANLSPHLLRHAWNDAFSRRVDTKGVAPSREAALRSEMMGWSPTSGTAATYNQRKIREEATEVSIKHQEKIGVHAKKYR